ncbi:LacI family DNA-binding transcriptional regulator [Anaerotalea alkaliphila]|uniref:LacI family transcriptional regulator n=1 Tax=Anaerotalea alkaliphila TaxID=2662126 RepID=A0A7X5KP46_9FIRM|nr:LacI family DNA-binding transcriptional regulator [Anaerotalea alkaliphila]NDL67517.1 LacI family transcriptional regulator [Anaerotalea alkaliphila]
MAYTIHDLARDAGVSSTTVSRVINNSGPVKDRTRAKILKLMEEKDYNPNPFARGLNNKSMKTIAVIINDIMNPFFTTVVKGIDGICQEQGFSFILSSIENNPVKERVEIENLTRKNVEGFIIVGSRPTVDDNSAYLAELSERYPVVLVNSKIRGSNKLYSVYIDEKQASLEVMDHLLSKNPKTVYFLGDVTWRTTHYKYKAFKEKLLEKGYAFDESLVIPCNYNYESGRAAVNEILSRNPGVPFSIFASSDMIAASVLKTLLEKGIHVPDEISLFGYSNMEISKLVHPGISTVDQKMMTLGKEGARLFIDLMDRKAPEKKNRKIPYELILRETT